MGQILKVTSEGQYGAQVVFIDSKGRIRIGSAWNNGNSITVSLKCKNRFTTDYKYVKEFGIKKDAYMKSLKKIIEME